MSYLLLWFRYSNSEIVEDRAAFERTRAENKAFLQQLGQNSDAYAATFRNLNGPNKSLNNYDIQTNNPLGAQNEILFNQLGVCTRRPF